MGDDIQLTEDTILTVPERVLSRRARGETVLLNLDAESYYGLDDVGSRFWELIETETSFGQAVATLLDEYEVERAVLEADLRRLLSELAENELVLIDAA